MVSRSLIEWRRSLISQSNPPAPLVLCYSTSRCLSRTESKWWRKSRHSTRRKGTSTLKLNWRNLSLCSSQPTQKTIISERSVTRAVLTLCSRSPLQHQSFTRSLSCFELLFNSPFYINIIASGFWGFGVLGFWGLGFGVWGLGFGSWGLGFWV